MLHWIMRKLSLKEGLIVKIESVWLIIEINYNDRTPEGAVSIIECDMNVDFAPPVGSTWPTARGQERNPRRRW